MFNYPAASLAARANLFTTYGLSFSAQERIGAFIVLYGRFESYLEWSIWALRGISPKGERPWTDTKNVTALIGECRLAADRHPEIAAAVKLACDTAGDLAMYRNAIAHGFLMPRLSPDSERGLFMTNLRWHGEVRKRSSQDAHVDENLLDLAVYSAETVSKTMMAICFMFKEPEKYTADIVLHHVDDLHRTRSMANELRHLTALMNSEKY